MIVPVAAARSSRTWLCSLGVALAVASPCAVRAQTVPLSDDTLAPATVESDIHRFTVEHDGAVVEQDETTLRANNAAGVDAIAQHYLWYDKDAERLDVLDAYTIDRAGRTLPVRPDQIRDVQEPRSAGAPTFQNAQYRVLVFPGVEPGARIHLTFRKVRKTAVVANEFSYFVEPTLEPVLEQKLIFDLPADKPLYADARGYTAQPPVTGNGRTVQEFDYRRERSDRIENGAVGYGTYGDRLMVSTYPDYATFTRRYREPALDASADDPSIHALALAVTRHAADTRGKAKALYDWVRDNIRYVSLFVGQSIAVPHHAVDIVANRYGDCKDHVALYLALLSALGIRAEAVLIGYGPVYTLPSVPGYGAGAINHAIVWIPSLQLFADTTANGIEFGYLPPALMDRPALLVDEGTLTRTPAAQPLGRDARLQVDVADSGNAHFAYRVEDRGFAAELERNAMRRANAQRREQIAAERIRQTGLDGSAKLSTGDLSATGGPFAETLDGTLEHIVWPTGTTALPALTSLSGGIATTVQHWLAEPARMQPYLCIGGDYDETAVITLPRRARVTELPPDASIHERGFDYDARYVFDDDTNAIQISRHLSARFPSQVCPAADYALARPVLQRIERDALADIIVK